jgi:hypothetical protein
MTVKYLDFPVIPKKFYQDVHDICTTSEDELYKFVGEGYSSLQLYPIKGELKEWILSNIPVEFGDCFHIHTIVNDVKPHKDHMNQKFKLNFIFHTGGGNVITNFYNDDKNLISSVCIKANTWHVFDGTISHSVHNIAYPRVAITLGTNTIL